MWPRIILALLLSLFVVPSFADGIEKVGDCDLSWVAATTGPPPSGFRLHWGATPGARTNSFDAGTANATTCSAAGFAEGQHYVVVRAYNAVGESADSNEIPFVLHLRPPDPPVLNLQ